MEPSLSRIAHLNVVYTIMQISSLRLRGLALHAKFESDRIYLREVLQGGRLEL